VPHISDKLILTSMKSNIKNCNFDIGVCITIISVKNCSLSTTYNGEMKHRKQQIMNGDITLEALRRCQRASKVISPFIIFAVFDVSFHRYKL